MSKDNILLYRSHSIPSGKYSICRATLSSSARKYDHTLKRTYTDEDVSSNSSTSTTLHSLTTENLKIHVKRVGHFI
jgi:hypothetical protein